MQKLIRRNERAVRQAFTKRAKKEEEKRVAEAWERRQSNIRKARDERARIKQSRLARAQDWETGALAPRRDVGEQATTYGAASMYNIQMVDLKPQLRPGWIPFHVGDRVVINKGRDKGKIGVISEIDRAKGGVQVKDVNMIDVHIPKWMKEQNGETRDIFSMALMIPLADINLVYPLPDPETGVHRDVIIERLEKIQDANRRAQRVIPGTNTIIPRPLRGEKPAEEEDYDDDTLRISVEEQTFRPPLIRAPMPMTVIDELRGKYSLFRTRHDYDYRVRKEAEDVATEARKGFVKTMRTPLQELADQRARQKAAAERELTSEQLAKIGEVILQEKERTTTFFKALQQDREQSQEQEQSQ